MPETFDAAALALVPSVDAEPPACETAFVPRPIEEAKSPCLYAFTDPTLESAALARPLASEASPTAPAALAVVLRPASSFVARSP